MSLVTEDDVHRHYWAVALTSALSARYENPIASTSTATHTSANAVAGPSSHPLSLPVDTSTGDHGRKPKRTPEEKERKRRKKEEKARRKTLQADLENSLSAERLGDAVGLNDKRKETDEKKKKKRKKRAEQEQEQERVQEQEEMADEAEIDELLPSSPVLAPLPKRRYKRNSSTFDRPDPQASAHPRPINTPRPPSVPTALPRHLLAEVGNANATPGSSKKKKKGSSWPTWATSTPDFLKRKRQET